MRIWTGLWSLFCMCVAVPALALTAAECREVTEKYGIQAIGCEAAATPIAQPEPTMDWQAMRESHVFFARGTELAAGEAQRLALLARVLRTAPLESACLRLVGHSDSSGPADANLQVSRDRVERIASYLSEQIAQSRIVEVVAAGEDGLLPGFAPDAAENRRVAIYAKTCPPG